MRRGIVAACKKRNRHGKHAVAALVRFEFRNAGLVVHDDGERDADDSEQKEKNLDPTSRFHGRILRLEKGGSVDAVIPDAVDAR